MYDFNARRANEQNSFATASLLLNNHTQKQYDYECASPADDMQRGIDIHWGPSQHKKIRYNISVRERIYTPQEMNIYKNDVTIRANDEMKKLISNVDAMVYIRRGITKKLLGYSIISFAAIAKEITNYECCDFNNDSLWYKKLPWLSYIQYSSTENGFYIIDIKSLPSEIVLAHVIYN